MLVYGQSTVASLSRPIRALPGPPGSQHRGLTALSTAEPCRGARDAGLPRDRRKGRTMKTRAAILRESPGAWSVEEAELDDPRDGEVLVEMVATGLCHSDHHLVTGGLPALHLPVVGGHEGAGIVRRTGPGVTGL